MTTTATTPRVEHPADRPSSASAVLLTIGQLACAHNLFGNLYEAVVRVPHRMSADHAAVTGDRRLPSLFSPTSPVRYYLPSVPVSVGATIGALMLGRRDRSDRRWLRAGVAAQVASTALTGYLVRNVNIKLFVAGNPITPNERDRLLRKWYRLNLIRIVLLSSAWVTTEKARLTSSATCTRTTIWSTNSSAVGDRRVG